MAYEFLDEGRGPQEEVFPTLSQAIKDAFSAMSQEVRVCMPGEVIKYDHKQMLIDARPYFKRQSKDGTTIDPPVIYNVPVAFPRAGNDSYITLPIKTGHSVLLIFSDRSLEKWLSNGQQGTPEDLRLHHISDAIAIPGCYPFSSKAKVNNADDLIIKNKDLEIRVKDNNHLQILNNSHELIKILEEWMTADITGAHTFKIRIRNKLRTFLEN